MATELYDLTIPAFVRGLTALSSVLDKGEAFALEKGAEPADFLNTRLIEDMAPLTSQIQRASDTAKFTLARVSGVPGPAMPDDETSFAALQERIASTLAYIHTVPRDLIDGKEEQEILVTFPHGSMTFTGRDYVLTFALPNFYFHVTTAYALLREKGVPIGKRDYLGG